MKNLFIHSSFLHSFLSELFQPFQKPLAMVFGIFDDPLPVFFGADAGNVSAAEAVHRRLIDHVAELGHLLKVVEKFFYRMPVLPAPAIMVTAAAYGEGYHEMFAGKGCSFGTIGKAMGKDFFYPVFDDGRVGIPVKGKLEYDDIRFSYIGLFFFHVQVPAEKVQAAKDKGQVRFVQRFQNGFIGQGRFQVRVAGND